MRGYVRITAKEQYFSDSCWSDIVSLRKALLVDNEDEYSSETYIDESKTLYFSRSVICFLLYDYMGTMKAKATLTIDRRK